VDSSGASLPIPPPGHVPLPAPCIEGYEILEELGRGGMGVVYKARQTGLNRVVALKMIRDGVLAGPEAVARFRVEAEAVARLEHPHIVHIYEVGEEGRRPFYSFEYLAGGSLKERLSGGPVAPAQAVELLEPIARAVHEAHCRGIVHRDLKPANILLAADGAPKVSDFGLAKRLEVSTGLTPTDAVLGTPGYMAPEQAGGHSRETGPAADIYALGAILYEFLTGRPPFTAASWSDYLWLVHTQEPVAPKRLQPKIPRDLETICLHCLHKAPARRYATARDLAEDLRRYQKGEPIQARRVGVAEKVWKWGCNHPAITLLLVSLAISVAAGFGGITKKWQDEIQQRQRADAEAADNLRQRIYLTTGQGEKRLDEGRLFDALLWFAKALQLDQDSPQRAAVHRLRMANVLRQCPRLTRVWFHEHPVVDVRVSQDGKRLLSVDVAAVARLWEVETGKLLHTVDRFVTGCLSPDGRRLALLRTPPKADGFFPPTNTAEPEFLLLEVDTARELARFTLAARPTMASFGQDGTRLVTAGPEGAAVFDTTRGGEPVVLLKHPGEVTWAEFDPSGQWVVTAGKDQTARVWDATAGQPAGPPALHLAAVTCAAFSPDGRAVVTAGLDRAALVWDWRTGRQTAPPLVHEGAVIRARFSPDGSRILTTSADRTARVWNAETSQPASPPFVHGATVPGGSFLPDGRRLLTASHDHLVRLWDLAHPDPFVLDYSELETVRQAWLSADGRRAVTAAGDTLLRVWEVGKDEPVRPPLKPTGPVTTVVFSAQEDRLATADGAGNVHVWNLDHGSVVASLPLGGGPHALTFSPDGQRVVVTTGDGSVRVWEIASPLARDLGKHQGPVLGTAFSPRGNVFVTTSADKTAKVWDPATGTVGSLLHDSTVYMASFSPLPNDPRVVTASRDHRARIWNWQSGHTLVLEHDSAVNHACFSPDGRLVVTACEGNTADIWDAAEGKRMVPPLRHYGSVRKASFDPQGRWVVTTTATGTVMVWDAATGAKLTPPLKHSRSLRDAVFGPAGDRVITLDAAGRVSVWKIFPDGGPDDLQALPGLAEVLMGNRLDPFGRLVPVEQGRFREAWHDLQTRVPGWLFPSAEAVRAWHRREAESLWSAGQWAGAESHLSQLIAADPLRWRLYHRRGVVRSNRNDDGQALRDYSRALELAGSELPSALWSDRGLASMKLARWTEAVEDFSKALGAGDQTWVTWANRASCEANLGRWLESAQDYAAAVRLNPGLAELWHDWALVQLLSGDLGGYQRTCSQMLTRFGPIPDPKTAGPVARICTYHAEAVADFQKVVELARPGRQINLAALGPALFRAGRYQEAVDQLRAAIQIHPESREDPVTHLFLALALFRLGNGGDAQLALRDAEHYGRRKPEDQKTWRWREQYRLLRQEAEALIKE
jgi:WD40 repeat protein/tetratricopeptide (TPR) repeat protein